jgi:hypothetical protein
MKVRPISQLWTVLGLIPRRRAKVALDIPLASRDCRNNLPNSPLMFLVMTATFSNLSAAKEKKNNQPIPKLYIKDPRFATFVRHNYVF